MSDQYQLVCIDTETNGLDLTDDILAISVRLLYPDGSPTDTEFYSLVYSDQPENKEAYAVNHISREDIQRAPHREELIVKLKGWWLKIGYGKVFSPMGHNFLGFDKPRVERLLGEANYRAMFHYHADDSMVIARSLQRCGLLPVNSCSLDILARFFNLKYENIHNASSDTYICGLVYSRLLKIQKPDFMTRLIRVIRPRYLGIKK